MILLLRPVPTALHGRGHFFGDATVRVFAGVLTPFLLGALASIPPFFGTITAVVAIGACPRCCSATIGQPGNDHGDGMMAQSIEGAPP